MLLYLIRHAQTASSQIDAFNGQHELPLTEAGRAQAKALGSRLSSVNFSAVYRSPLDRTRETGSLVAPAFAAEMVILPGLTEIDYGAWEGLSSQEAELKWPAEFIAWREDAKDHAPVGGETAQRVADRALAALAAIRVRYEESAAASLAGPVLAISHKATLRILACALLGAPLGNYRKSLGQDECALNLIELHKTKAPFIRLWNDTAHLGSDPAQTTRTGH
jgi:broad specificity phosphatase PhoE